MDGTPRQRTSQVTARRAAGGGLCRRPFLDQPVPVPPEAHGTPLFKQTDRRPATLRHLRPPPPAPGHMPWRSAPDRPGSPGATLPFLRFRRSGVCRFLGQAGVLMPPSLPERIGWGRGGRHPVRPLRPGLRSALQAAPAADDCFRILHQGEIRRDTSHPHSFLTAVARTTYRSGGPGFGCGSPRVRPGRLQSMPAVPPRQHRTVRSARGEPLA